MVGLTESEKQLRYVKYYNQELAPIPADKQAVAEGPAADSSLALPFEERNQFLAGKDTGLNSGFCVMENGLGYVANATFMPGVTVTMCDWWFGWHSVGDDLRYKLWDHDDHYYARADKPGYVTDPKVPLNQKTWGVSHSIKEDIGMGPEDITLHFKNPADVGYDPAFIGTDKCRSLVCAVGEGASPAFMTHKFYETEGGTMFESRFWMGVGYVSGNLVKLLPEGIKVPDFAPRALFAHNIKEYANLAAILPHIYAEEKDNW